MKFIFDKTTLIYSSTDQIGIIVRAIPRDRRVVMLMLIILAIALAACNRSQQASSSANGGAHAPGTPTSALATQTPSGDAGGAVLNLERWAFFFGGKDEQREVGTIQLEFSETKEEHLVVEGTGKMVWTENSTLENCSYKIKTEADVTVFGIYNVDYCKLVINDLGSKWSLVNFRDSCPRN